MTARTTETSISPAQGNMPQFRLAHQRFREAAATRHFWLIAAMIAVAGLLHYFEPIASRIRTDVPWGLDEYSMARSIFLLPITYAGFMFGGAGGIVALVLSAAIMIPRCAYSDDHLAASLETAAVVLVGALVVTWFRAQVTERERSHQALSALRSTREKLRSHLAALRLEEKALETLNSVYLLCSQSLNLDEILSTSTEKIMGVMEADFALVFLLEEDDQELALVAHRGVSDTFVAEMRRLRLGERVDGRVTTMDRPIVVPNGPDDPRLPKEAVHREGIKSGVLVPIRAHGRVFGTLCAGVRSNRGFSSEESDLLGACGNAIGVAIENARLYQRVSASETRYRDLFENASDAIFAHDFEGRIVAANEACSRLTGYASDELMGMDARRLFPENDPARVQAMECRLAAGFNGEGHLEVSLVRKDGTAATIDLASTLLGNEQRPEGVQHIARDVTEERRAQESLRHYVRQVTRAQEDERLRISRDLHDETAQSLLLVSQRLDRLISEQRWWLRPEAKHCVEDVRQLTLQTLSDLRRLSEALRPRILDDLGLVPALGWLVDEVTYQDGIEGKFEVEGAARDLPGEEQTLLFRIAQEALTNVRRHAGASHVDVTVAFGDDKLVLTVRDDGGGFVVPDPASDLAATGKLGILGMIERARLLGGQLSIRSEQGAGTTVSVEVPT